jgi:hypothetical protein
MPEKDPLQDFAARTFQEFKEIREIAKRLEVSVNDLGTQSKLTGQSLDTMNKTLEDLKSTVWGNGSEGLRTKVDRNSWKLNIIQWVGTTAVAAVIFLVVKTLMELVQ